MLEILSCSADRTIELGKIIGTMMLPGDFIALTGDLGSGKTHFARGVVAGVGADPSIPVTSPTYTLMNVYSGRFPLYHFDLYRLSGATDFLDLGFEEYFYGAGACIVEWAERLHECLPDEKLTVAFSYEGEDSRKIVLDSSGSRYDDLIRQFAALMTEPTPSKETPTPYKSG